MTLFIVGVLGVLALLVVLARDLVTQYGAQAKRFAAGTFPSPVLDGPYAGTVPGRTVSWQGKTFNAKEGTGINRFTEGDTVIAKYPFKTFTGAGLRDHDTTVLKIDYDIPGNPWWLRHVLDELVQTGEGTYLGKLLYRVGPIPIGLGYFELSK